MGSMARDCTGVIRSFRPWNRPVDGCGRCAQPADLLPRWTFTVSPIAAPHGLNERLLTVVTVRLGRGIVRSTGVGGAHSRPISSRAGRSQSRRSGPPRPQRTVTNRLTVRLRAPVDGCGRCAQPADLLAGRSRLHRGPPRPFGLSSFRPWNRPVDGCGRCAQPADLLPRWTFTVSPIAAPHGLNERLQADDLVVSVRSGRGMGPVKRISHVEARPHKVLSFCW